MKIKLSWCFFISIIISSYATAGVFSGTWSGENESKDGTKLSTLQLKLIQTGQNIEGSYCYISHGGARIDCAEKGEINLHGFAKGTSAVISFNSTFGKGDGRAKLEINKDIMIWGLIKKNEVAGFSAPIKYQLKLDDDD